MRTFLAMMAVLFATIAAATAATAKDYSHYRERCAEIRDDVENWLTAEGVTPDYFYLLVAESHCKDRRSTAGAVGYWQMMPATARKYGCVDPHDLECETRAAARYLRHLEEKCGTENAIYCWHDGGSNFLRRGTPSKGAEGLAWQVRYLMRTDNPQYAKHEADMNTRKGAVAMKKEELEQIKSAVEAYEARRAGMRMRYQSIRCGNCGGEILPGDDLWAPWSHTDRAYCSAECAAMALGAQCLEMDDDDYAYFLTEKTAL